VRFWLEFKLGVFNGRILVIVTLPRVAQKVCTKNNEGVINGKGLVYNVRDVPTILVVLHRHVLAFLMWHRSLFQKNFTRKRLGASKSWLITVYANAVY
jgi:hypothetical protein